MVLKFELDEKLEKEFREKAMKQFRYHNDFDDIPLIRRIEP
ncbi:MAG TPA: hypothetical protein VFE88_04580 [Candidatus Nanoarchaeia archaeon]|nr:hypothetical protein [Candidatus Nanoarchaeia archaeon]